jgi:HEAT repeat protein
LVERFGQLSAIEAFEHLGGAAAGPVLIDLLSSEHDTVREWSALAIEQLGVRDAVPALQAAYQRLRVSDGRLDDSEAVAIRRVLTQLGAATGTDAILDGVVTRVGPWPGS